MLQMPQEIGNSTKNDAQHVLGHVAHHVPATYKMVFGMYLSAFCNGLHDVMGPYNLLLIEMEKDYLNDPTIPLLTIVTKAENHARMFKHLNSIISQMKRDNLRGCEILELLHTEIIHNVGSVKEALQTIIRYCHNVLYKQLSNWLMHGQLIDSYNEFFIQSLPDRPFETLASESFTSQEASCSTPLIFFPHTTSSHKFAVQYPMLPSYIKPSVAEKILFIGETIVMFGCDPKDKKHGSYSRTSIWDEKEGKFYKKLQNLQSMKIFNVSEFEKTIDEFRSYVTQHLWKIAVEEADLFVQIKLLKDFFLLGRGELFLEFILQASPILYHHYHVNQAFHIAARKILLNDEVVEKFRFILPGKSELKDMRC
ncbi:hypothetical protein L9F63_003080, partial [Diploptera punctata]